MDRLTLKKRPKTAERQKCLPAGDGLPSWSTLPLDAKFPMVPNSKGSVVFCTTKLCEPKHRSSRDYDFDLSDPYCHVVTHEYHPLHDRHLHNHFNMAQMRRHLLKNGYVTNDGKVVCNLREFNRYRQYLRRICLMEMARENRELKKEENKICRDHREGEDSPTDIRIKIVRERLAHQREITRQRIEEILQHKAERLQKRLEELNALSCKRDLKKQMNEKKRQQVILKHQEEIMKRNRALLRRWRVRDRQHKKRLEEKRKLRLIEQSKKSFDAWENRKSVEKERIAVELKVLQTEQSRRDESMKKRDALFDNHRRQIEEKIERCKKRTKELKEEKEEKCARLLARKIARIRTLSRRRGRWRKTRHHYFHSQWGLEDSLRDLNLSQLSFSGKTFGESDFLRLLDTQMKSEVLQGDNAMEGEMNEHEYNNIIEEQARSIVDGVLMKAQEIACRNQEQLLDIPGLSLGKPSRSVTFGAETLIAPGLKVEGEGLENYRPVSEHVLTPVSSAMNKHEYKSEPSPEQKDKIFVERLLHKLLDDLENDRLQREDLVQLTSHCMHMIGIIDDEPDVDILDSAVADDLVKFTLGKVLDDIRSGSISNDDLTDLTLSVLNGSMEETITSNEEEDMSMYVDETLKRILSSDSLDRESPVDDGMLDDFIIKTLRDVAKDVEEGILDHCLINKMLQQIRMEVKNYPCNSSTADTFQQLLKNLIEELSVDRSDLLYKVINIIVTNYHKYKESSSKGISELITTVVDKLSACATSGAIDAHELDMNTLCGLAIKITAAPICTSQIYQLTEDVASALEIPCEKDNTDLLKVPEIIKDAKACLVNADVDRLKKVAQVVTQNYGGIKNNEFDTEKQDFLDNVSSFVVDILKLVWKSIDKGEFTDSDISEMTRLCRNVSRGPKDSFEKEERAVDFRAELSNTIVSILDDVEQGNLKEEEIFELGEKLQECGHKLLSALPEKGELNRGPSLTSTVVAEDVVTHVLSSIQADYVSDIDKKESLKELAKCVLETTLSSQSNIEDPTCLYPSPCDSKLAEDIVNTTIEEIANELNEGKIPRHCLSSVAVSALGMYDVDTNDHERVTNALSSIINSLKTDSISSTEAQNIFSIILDAYKNDWKREMFPGETITSSDSQLAESLIRETLSKVERDLQSGFYSDDDIVTLAGSYLDDQEQNLGIGHQKDIVNLIISIIQELMTAVQTNSFPAENVMKFVRLFDERSSPTEESLITQLSRVLSSLRSDGVESQHFKNIIDIAKRSQNADDLVVTELRQVLAVVKSDVLSNFVRMTLQSILSSNAPLSDTKAVQEMETSIGETKLRSITSLLADNIVKNLIWKIEHNFNAQDDSEMELLPLSINEEILNEELKTREVDTLGEGMLSNLSDMILETLNNVISNMRLEEGTSPTSKLSEIGMASLAKKVPSQMVHDFVLEKLQSIVESMQDGSQLDKTSKYILSRHKVAIKDSESLLAMNDHDAKSFVLTNLNEVVKDMSQDIEQSIETVEKESSTLSLEAEAIVMNTIQRIISSFSEIDANEEMFEEDILKKMTIQALQNMKKDVEKNSGKPIKDALASAILESSPQIRDQFEGKCLVKSTIDLLINKIEQEEIKASDVCRLDHEVSTEILKVMNSEDEKQAENISPRPSVSLTKMADLTAKMLKLHIEMKGSNSDCNSPLEGYITNALESIVKESLDKTISNVKSGSLSDKNLIELAAALSQGELEQDACLKVSSSSIDSSIEDFITDMLEDVKKDINEKGLSSYRFGAASEKVLSWTSRSDAKASESISSVSSQVLTNYVNDVLLKIAESIDNFEINKEENDLIRSESVDTQSSKTSITKNVNPNAIMITKSSSTSVSTEIPTRNKTPVAISHKQISTPDCQSIENFVIESNNDESPELTSKSSQSLCDKALSPPGTTKKTHPAKDSLSKKPPSNELKAKANAGTLKQSSKKSTQNLTGVQVRVLNKKESTANETTTKKIKTPMTTKNTIQIQMNKCLTNSTSPKQQRKNEDKASSGRNTQAVEIRNKQKNVEKKQIVKAKKVTGFTEKPTPTKKPTTSPLSTPDSSISSLCGSHKAKIRIREVRNDD